MHASLLVLVDFADLTCGMLALHAFTFDPGWWRGGEAARGMRVITPRVAALTQQACP